MSVPTAQLQRLRLSGGMPAHTRSMSGTSASNVVRERAIIMRDILFNLDRGLPLFEYRPDIFQEIITRPSISSDPQYYLRQDDLEGTLFRVGSYNLDCFGALCQFHPIYNLARIFCETLEGRFRQLFEEYDKQKPTSANMEPSAALTRIIQDLRDYYEKAEQDRAERRARETPDNPTLTRDIDRRFATMLVRQIRALCERSKVVTSFSEAEPVRKKAKTATVRPNQRSPRAPPTTKSYLFQEMLGNDSHHVRPFVLGVLEKCVPESLVSLQSDQDGQPGLRSLLTLLESEGAAQDYQERFAALVTKEEEEEEEDEE